MATIADTPEGITYFQLLTFKGSLSIEVSTGMTHSRGSVLAAYNRQMGTSFRTKVKALEDVTVRLRQAKVEQVLVNEARGCLIEAYPEQREFISSLSLQEVKDTMGANFDGGWSAFVEVCTPLIEDLD